LHDRTGRAHRNQRDGPQRRVVAAGAKIPAETVAAGAPAVVKKKLEGAAIWWIDAAGPEYVHLSRSYLQHGIGDPEMHELAAAKVG
jgi:hypothetical protein